MIIETFTERKEKPIVEDTDWGTVFSDWMLEINYKDGSWGEVVLKQYGPMTDIEPSNCTFHYSASVFEGAKAYRTENDNINLFRPDENLARINRSHERICIPQFTESDKERILDGLKQMLKFDKDWVPSFPNSLYIRHFTISTENFVGLRPAKTYRSMIIMTPVNQYLGGFKDIKLWVPTEYTRAVSGGIGGDKISGNYCGTLKPVEEAHRMGYDQVLYLTDKNVISEASAANIFFVIDDKLITPKLNGTILPGITRKSIIELAKYHKMDVREEFITIETLKYYYNHYRLNECFLCGTAACIVPVSEIYFDEDTIKPNQDIGEITKFMYKELTDIQYGKKPDPYNWVVKVI